jgi:hypothetical protein
MPFQLTRDLSAVASSKDTKEETQGQEILAGQIKHVQRISERATDEKPYF